MSSEEGGGPDSSKGPPYSTSQRKPSRLPQHQHHPQTQHAQSPRRPQTGPSSATSSAAAQQMSGYMVHQPRPPPQQQHRDIPPMHSAYQATYPPGQPPPYSAQLYPSDQYSGMGPQHLQQQRPTAPYGHSQYRGLEGRNEPSTLFTMGSLRQLPPSRHQPIQEQPYHLQPRFGRLPADRPIMKLSVSLIETYKQINKVYYEEREARRAARAAQKAFSQQQGHSYGQKQQQQTLQPRGPGTQNNGWDDDNYDYILTTGEVIMDRYVIQKRIGKGSFGQVVQALDKNTNKEVAIKIIKSKKPFLMQAKTEIGLLNHLNSHDREDQHNIVQLLSQFMHKNHQCLVFEMLSLNLYELLKNTHFAGVSLNLIRKFAKQILKALSFLAQPDIDIIHCDLKPENILLRHPKRSGIKVIDFGSSCKSSKRMYSYIQSRFYRSPEVMLGMPYSVAIDMWSLGCILVEMHTGEPLFSGTDQFDQMQKIVAILGMVPNDMIERADEQHRHQFFERRDGGWTIKQSPEASPLSTSNPIIYPSKDPLTSLKDVVAKEADRNKKYTPVDESHSSRSYDRFVDLIYSMLTFHPSQRIRPEQALEHPFITNQDGDPTSSRP
mmetsp:Transcript_9455/g.19600  ORF Transcript_9455/g.19600 Transcript_9455/m.19600 type:complete len:605 (-) Transcript_9455:430-2244(-)